MTVAQRSTENTYLGATPDPAKATRDAMDAAKNGLFPLVEIFYSLQGEGLRAGEATIFVRFAGCNLACDFCDTDFRPQLFLSESDLLQNIDEISHGCKWVCLTGGEPSIHNLLNLCGSLHKKGYKIQMETNGTRSCPDWQIDHITVSPKQPQGGRLQSWYEIHAAEFKYIIDSELDIERALEGVNSHHKPTSLQPNALNSSAVELAISAVKQFPMHFRLSLQTHKYLHIR